MVLTASFVGEITTSLTTVLGWLSTVLSAILGGDLGALSSLVTISVAISLIFLTVKVFKGFSWGT